MLRLLFLWEPVGDCETQQALAIALRALTERNVQYLLRHPGTPSLYSSGVRYADEDGREEWRDIPMSLQARRVDCEDLACWRAAELIVSGTPAEAYSDCRRVNSSTRLYHILVRTIDGHVEDPSKILGMKG